MPLVFNFFPHDFWQRWPFNVPWEWKVLWCSWHPGTCVTIREHLSFTDIKMSSECTVLLYWVLTAQVCLSLNSAMIRAYIARYRFREMLVFKWSMKMTLLRKGNPNEAFYWTITLWKYFCKNIPNLKTVNLKCLKWSKTNICVKKWEIVACLGTCCDWLYTVSLLFWWYWRGFRMSKATHNLLICHS